MKRNTLNKQIASATTFAQKWELALIGGTPTTPIQELPRTAAMLRDLTLRPPMSKAEAIERLKAQFANLLFPALMEDKSGPLEELIEAMAQRRRNPNLLAFHLAKPGEKKEAGRKLRLALLTTEPEDRVSLAAVCKYLDRTQVDYPDQSHVWKIMQEVSKPLLKSGDRVQWFANLKWSKKKEVGMTRLIQGENGLWQIGMLIRELLVTQGGKLVNRGMTREQLSKVSYKCSREVRAL
jgi:hypothetical protein